MDDLRAPPESAYGICCSPVRFTAQRGFSLDKTNRSTRLGQCYGTRSTYALIGKFENRIIDSGNVSRCINGEEETGHWSFMQNQLSNKYVTPSSTGDEHVLARQVEQLGRRNGWCGIHEVVWMSHPEGVLIFSGTGLLPCTVAQRESV